MVVTSSTSGASLSIFSSHILYDERVIDQTIDTRIKLASALAKQWFGVYITPESPNDGGLVTFFYTLICVRFVISASCENM
jgi:transcription initiation factor TFIID subunit 2